MTDEKNTPPAAGVTGAAAPSKTTRARVLRNWRGHTAGEFADLSAVDLRDGKADGAVDVNADEDAVEDYLAEQKVAADEAANPSPKKKK